MDRRTFLIRSAWLTAGGILASTSPSLAKLALKSDSLRFDSDLYKTFKDPASIYYPFVRWWWNGDILDADELRRELQVMKKAGIGGVEINPIQLPPRDNDMGMLDKATPWLSDKWIDMLNVTFDEAKRLDMTCDLLVGSGWPFGAEYLRGDERAMVRLVDAQELEGPCEYEISQFALFAKVDPHATETSEVRTMKIVSLSLVPSPMDNIDQAIDLTDQKDNEIIRVQVPAGKHYFYAVVQVNAFACVINGAPGAAGPILNHLDKTAVRKYLDHMSDTIQSKIGPLKGRMRTMFTDSMELEGMNWTTDFREEFIKRRGYDIVPYMPYMMFKTGRLGDVYNFDYGVEKTPRFKDENNRMRYDFELTKAELLRERFNATYLQWCKDLGVMSRAQAYGRGFFPLESRIGYDIPEGESWTTNWLKHRLGEEMSNEDYRRGRGYTMINKFVSSAAHLTGKRVVSCEEMTNTYQVFAATLEFLKLGSDMSLISGVTQSFWIGVNYSPLNIPFPGWVRYGAYFSEHNNWWPYVSYINTYKARVSSVLQNADMYTDIAILPAYGDMWTTWGVQTEPFPVRLNVPYMTLLWEAMIKNGHGCDYTSEIVLADSTVKNGKLCYGPKQYGTLFLAGVKGLAPETLAKMYEFVQQGGRVFCVERYPDRCLGYRDYENRNREVQQWVEKLKAFPDRFILLDIPADNDFISWFTNVQEKYGLKPFVRIETIDPYFMQNRYQADDGSEIFFFVHSHLHKRYKGKVTFAPEITKGRYPWIWDTHTGERYRIELNDGSYTLEMSPADSRLIVFDKNKKGPMWRQLPVEGVGTQTLRNWDVELKHSREGWTKTTRMEDPTDLKDTEFVNFTGTVTYRTTVDVTNPADMVLNLGRVWGVAEVKVNDQDLGVRWYGDQTYDVASSLKPGTNRIEVKVTTTLLNYMKTLKDNKTAQYWTMEGTKNQPLSSMGMVGPVTLYQIG